MRPPAVSEARSLLRLLLRWTCLLAIAYVGVVLVLLFFENKLVFRPCAADEDWWPPPVSEMEDVELTSADGTRIHCWHCPDKKSDLALLYFHGNAGNLSHRGGSVAKMRQALKASVLIVDYPGYGKSGGKPTEKGCYLAADAAYDWLVTRGYRGEKIFIYGGSLGGAVAVDLASRKPNRGLILVKTFTSAPDVGASFYPFLPVRWLMRNRFDSLVKIKDVHAPVFIAHGHKDEVIPFKLGKRLFEAANEPKEFFELDGQGHNDRLGEDFFRALLPFLERTTAGPSAF